MKLKTYTYSELSDQEKKKICSDRYRNNLTEKEKMEQVQTILDQVKKEGDQVLLNLARKFDRIDLESIQLDSEEFDSLAEKLSPYEKEAIDLAYENIYKFHAQQAKAVGKINTSLGVECWKEYRPIDPIGIYIPGGTAPLLSTFLMLGIPAKLAGVNHIVVCTPAQKGAYKIHPALAYIARKLGILKIFLVGGAQAIGAMAYGTQSISKVHKIFGPGNTYVTLAKQWVQMNTPTAIDMPAGPSEVLILADQGSNLDFVASDLLAQAEHGTDSQVVLVVNSKNWLENLEAVLEKQLETLPRKTIALEALRNSFCILVDDMLQGIEFSNLYAPEHLILSLESFDSLIPFIQSAGSVFLGPFSPESAGDYASGTNHTLPTSGFAQMYSGVSLESFLKNISFQYINQEGIKHLAPTVIILAEMEGLDAHARSAAIRIQSLS